MSREFTSEWLRNREIIMRQKVEPPPTGDGVEHEAGLHDEILAACRARCWLAVHSRMDRATTNAAGTPDFIIVAPGRVFFIECKSRSGKRTPTQIGWAMKAEHLGHTVHTVRSFGEFLSIITPTTQEKPHHD